MSDNDKVHIRTIEVAAQLPVFVCDLTLIKAQLDLAREGIEELRITHPQSPESNVKATYMSPWHSHLLNPKFIPLTESVLTIAREVSRRDLSANLGALNLDLVVTDCWGIIYEQSSYTQRHNHFPSEFSCSIYLEAHEDSAPIIFSEKLHIKPKPNMLVMFPGILIHEVPATEGRRVVVAMNLNKRALFDSVKT
jgi:hypothetical protein